jgi:hypothetical protein
LKGTARRSNPAAQPDQAVIWIASSAFGLLAMTTASRMLRSKKDRHSRRSFFAYPNLPVM